MLEETGVAIYNVHFAAAENVLFESGAHYVVIFMHGEAALVSGAGRCPQNSMAVSALKAIVTYQVAQALLLVRVQF